VNESRIVAAVFAGVLATAVAAESRVTVAAGAALSWGWPGYGPYAPHRYGVLGYGWIGPWLPCGVSACIDDPYLRRATRRELERIEHHRELEERAQRGLQSYGMPLHGARGDWPPPTPEAQVQPAYHGSGEIRPEFSRAGEPREDSAGPPR
jgi:hypothetical protein